MKAIVKPQTGPGLEIQDVPMPTIGIDDVLVKITKTAICGTDVHIDIYDAWAQKTLNPPLVIGHEFVGVIEEVGSNVKGFSVGERVSGEGHLVCGVCKACRSERHHLCPNTKGIGVQCNGAFAEYLSMPARNIWSADPSISDDVMACFDPLGNAVHSCLHFDLVGKDVLITGAGPIGCMSAAIAKQAGARHVVVTDINPYRMELAKKMGASVVLDDRKVDLRDVVKDLGLEYGFDVGLEMSGSPRAFTEMLEVVRSGANVVLLGIIPDGTPIDWTKVIFKNLTIKGTYGREIYRTWYQTTALINAGLDIVPLITHKFHYTDFRKGFDLMRSGESGKVILDWT